MSGGHESGAAAASSHHLNGTAVSHHLNGTAALGPHDQSLFEFRVFNIVIVALASCILTVTGVYCITVCYKRTRQSKRALVYESVVTRDEPADPVAVKAVKRSTSFMNSLALFRKPEAARADSRIYYIYSNPLPVRVEEVEVEEEEEQTRAPPGPEEQTALSQPLSFQEYAEDPGSGVILDPPISLHAALEEGGGEGWWRGRRTTGELVDHSYF